MTTMNHKDQTGANLHIPFIPQEGDPGAIGAYKGWYKPSTNEIFIRNSANTGWANSIGAAAAGNPFPDSEALVKDNTDATKLVGITADAVATGTRRNIIMPNADVDLGDMLSDIAALQAGGTIDTSSPPPIFEEFFGGAAAATGQIGKYGWAMQNSGGAVTQTASDANHQGVIMLHSNTGANQHSSIWLQTLAAASMHTDGYFDMQTEIKIDNTAAPFRFRFGLALNASLTANDEISIHKLENETDLSAYTKSGANTTVQSLGVMTSFVGSWIRLRIRRISATEIGFTVNNNTEVVISTNVPSSAALAPSYQCGLSSASGGRFVSIDWFYLELWNMSRFGIAS